MRKLEDPEPEAQFLTPGQAAKLLHVSPKTVDRWADQGRVPCLVTLGGHRRFSRQVIESVAQQMGGTEPEVESKTGTR